MLREGIAENNYLHLSSPLLIGPKQKDPLTGEQNIKLEIEYRRVSEQCLDDKFPMPNIADIYDRLGSAVIYISIDFSQGYYKTKISKDSRKITAFSTP